ncbi:MAG: class I SAM-dependent methyltransferase family protein [Nanohaloarchaea archaeon QH_8_44_6]|nr:MAG: class I SAM-dependent methyltransferase family protein [Nanohaloarchaea archaeon QH_8_44_6]
MEQEKLESKVRELFERQGFQLESTENGFRAEKNNSEMVLKVFSSEEYSHDEIPAKVEKNDKLFIDPDLSELEELVENDISVLEEEKEDQEFETPSYEVIGNIAVINDLAGVDRKEAVDGILHHQNVKTILLKKGGLEGEFRVGNYEKLYGEKTKTVHTEFGCDYRVDPTKVYFSERFSTERKRVVNQIEDGEKVLVMFSGVGPFAILAARESDPEKVVAIEKNPDGADYLKENILINSVEETVEGIEGDVREVLPELNEKFDRVIMPLPESADEFLELASEDTEYNGVIHYYRFLENDNWKELENEISEKIDNYEIMDKVECGERGPSVKRVCIDIRIR